MGNIKLTEKEIALIEAAVAEIKAKKSLDSLKTITSDVIQNVDVDGWSVNAAGEEISKKSAIKEKLLSAASAAGINVVAAAAMIDEGISAGQAARAAAIAADPVTLANAAAVAEIKANPCAEQLSLTVYALIKTYGLKPEQIDRASLIAAANTDRYVSFKDTSTEALEAGIKAALAGSAEIGSGEIEGHPPLIHVRQAVAAAAHSETQFISVAEFTRLMAAAEVLEMEGRVILASEAANDAAIEAEIAAIRKNPTLKQLKESALRVAVPTMLSIDKSGWKSHSIVEVHGDKVNVEIFERLCAALADAAPVTYAQPIKPEIPAPVAPTVKHVPHVERNLLKGARYDEMSAADIEAPEAVGAYSLITRETSPVGMHTKDEKGRTVISRA